MAEKHQCLIFAMTRKNAVAWAKEAGLDVVKELKPNQKKELEKISKENSSKRGL